MSHVGDHDHIAKEVTKAVLSLPDITAVSEVQVYYKDDGRIVVKVDVSMNPELTIRAAHALAGKNILIFLLLLLLSLMIFISLFFLLQHGIDI